jgi:hypothetical protein
MNVYSRVDIYIHVSLTSALVTAQFSTLLPGCYNHEKIAPSLPIGYQWMGTRAGLDDGRR